MTETTLQQQWVQRDLNVLWHPCTQMKDHETLPLIPIKKANGAYLEDFDGNRYLDAVSSWWVNLFGHSNPTINAAIKEQLDTLEHVIFAGFTHPGAIELAERLAAITPANLSRTFYADNGSSAVEVALKMSFQYWHNLGQTKKTKFVNIANAYHGETTGALSVSDIPLFKETYRPLLWDVFTAPSPDCFNREQGESWQDYSQRQFVGMEAILAKHHEEISAVIIEPLVQCAGSMRMYHPIYLSMLRAACDRYNVHLIADEVAVGFGRTGTMFACEQADISPDFLCLSKGITGGYLPLSAVVTTEKVYDAFYDDYNKLNAFFHSHSYSGNPLAVNAALATLDIFDKENTIEKNKALAKVLTEVTMRFVDHPHVAEVRQQGMIVAIEMIKDKATKQAYPWQERRGLRVYEYALTQGVLLRPQGNVIYFIPPYIITPEQITQIAQVAWDGIALATKDD